MNEELTTRTNATPAPSPAPSPSPSPFPAYSLSGEGGHVSDFLGSQTDVAARVANDHNLKLLRGTNLDPITQAARATVLPKLAQLDPQIKTYEDMLTAYHGHKDIYFPAPGSELLAVIKEIEDTELKARSSVYNGLSDKEKRALADEHNANLTAVTHTGSSPEVGEQQKAFEAKVLAALKAKVEPSVPVTAQGLSASEEAPRGFVGNLLHVLGALSPAVLISEEASRGFAGTPPTGATNAHTATSRGFAFDPAPGALLTNSVNHGSSAVPNSPTNAPRGFQGSTPAPVETPPLLSRGFATGAHAISGVVTSGQVLTSRGFLVSTNIGHNAASDPHASTLAPKGFLGTAQPPAGEPTSRLSHGFAADTVPPAEPATNAIAPTPNGKIPSGSGFR